MFARYCCLDLEMTGLRLKRDRVIDICAFEMAGNERTGRKFSTLVNPDRSIPLKTQRIHAITDEKVKDKPRFAEIAYDFVKFLGDSPIVVHAGMTDGSTTDEAFLNMELRLSGFDAIPSHQFVNQLPMAKEIYKTSSFDHVLDQFGIDRSQRGFHGAEIDSYLLTQSYPLVYEIYEAYKKVRTDFQTSVQTEGTSRLAELLKGWRPTP